MQSLFSFPLQGIYYLAVSLSYTYCIQPQQAWSQMLIYLTTKTALKRNFITWNCFQFRMFVCCQWFSGVDACHTITSLPWETDSTLFCFLKTRLVMNTDNFFQSSRKRYYLRIETHNTFKQFSLPFINLEAPYVYMSGNRNSCNAKLHVTQCLDYIGESCMVFFARCLTLYCKNYIISQSQRRVFVLRRYILCANSNYTSEICISRKSREEIRNLELRASLRTVDPGNEVAWKRGQRLHRLRKFFCPPFWIYLEKDYRRYELFFSKEAIFLTTLWVNKVNLMFSQWRNPGWVEFYGGVCVFRWRGVWRDRWQIIPLRSSLV